MAALKKEVFDRLRWEIVRLLRRHGPFPIVALLVSIAAVLIGSWGAWLHQRGYLIDQRLRVNASAPQRTPPESFESMSVRLETLRGQLPNRTEIPAVTQKIHRLADKHQIRLAQGEYRLSADTVAKLVRYQINLPVRGEASRIQGFVIAALNDIRPLALEGLSFKREKGQSANADAQIQFVLLARP